MKAFGERPPWALMNVSWMVRAPAVAFQTLLDSAEVQRTKDRKPSNPSKRFAWGHFGRGPAAESDRMLTWKRIGRIWTSIPLSGPRPLLL